MIFTYFVHVLGIGAQPRTKFAYQLRVIAHLFRDLYPTTKSLYRQVIPRVGLQRYRSTTAATGEWILYSNVFFAKMVYSTTAYMLRWQMGTVHETGWRSHPSLQ